LSFDPYIIEDITVSINPNIPLGNLDTYVTGDIVRDPKLVITHDLVDQCEVRLAYEVYSYSNGMILNYVDALSGDLLLSNPINRNLPASTPLYGPVDIGLTNTNTNITSLNEEDVATYDLTSLVDDNYDLTDIWTEALIPTTNNVSTWDNSTPFKTAMYQSHFVAQYANQVFSEDLGINFEKVNVGVIRESGEKARSLVPAFEDRDEAWILISDLNETSFYNTVDIMSHELTHSYLGEQLDINYGIANNNSMHEGIAEMFGVYGEYRYQANTLDWVLADEDPLVAMDLDRNLSAPGITCYSQIIDEGNQYTRSEPLIHWFYLITDGNDQQGIPALGI
jgi:hypothetical protein